MNNKKKIIGIFVLILIAVTLTIISSYKETKIEKYSVTNSNIIDEKNENKDIQNEVVNSIQSDGNRVLEQNAISQDNTTALNITNENTTKEEKEKAQSNEENKVEENKTVEEKVTKKTTKENKIESTYDKDKFSEDGHLKKYPSFGEKYGILKISKIGVNAPISFGDTQEILEKSVGHYAGSYFVGENGSVILMGHNYKYNFSRCGELKNGDIIEVQTDYGDFFYKIYNSEIVLDTDGEKLEIQNNEERLMIYTCYPFHNSSYTEYRYVIFAKKI